MQISSIMGTDPGPWLALIMNGLGRGWGGFGGGCRTQPEEALLLRLSVDTQSRLIVCSLIVDIVNLFLRRFNISQDFVNTFSETFVLNVSPRRDVVTFSGFGGEDMTTLMMFRGSLSNDHVHFCPPLFNFQWPSSAATTAAANVLHLSSLFYLTYSSFLPRGR